MTKDEAKKRYTRLLKFCGTGYYKKLESGKQVDPIPDNILIKLNEARSLWIDTLKKEVQGE